MKHQDRLIKDLAKKYNKDPRVIKEIVWSPIKFANRVISDPTDSRPIRIRYFGVFALKHKDAKFNLYKDRVKRLKKDMIGTMLILDTMGFLIKDYTSVNRILDDALDSGDFEKIETIWDEHVLLKRSK